MLTDQFAILIDELSKVLQVKLTPDANNACQIRYPDGLEVRLDPDRLGETLFITCELGPIQQGRYRENLFKEALKVNGLPPPCNGIFAFNPKKETLLLFEQVLFFDLNGIKLSDLITSFSQKARIWKDGINRGDIPSYRANEMSFGAAPRGTGFMGLR